MGETDLRQWSHTRGKTDRLW